MRRERGLTFLEFALALAALLAGFLFINNEFRKAGLKRAEESAHTAEEMVPCRAEGALSQAGDDACK